MNRSTVRISKLTRISFLALVAILAFGEPAITLYVILPVFIAVIGWLIWRDQDRIAELEKRLAALEPSPPPTPKEP